MTDHVVTCLDPPSLDMQASRPAGKAIGGRAQADALSPGRRREIARAAARARWGSEPVVATIEPVRLCRLGHALKVYQSGCVRCPVCVAATGKRWRAKNPDYHRAWRKKNRERWAETQRRWREAHREQIRSYHASWRAANRDRAREYQRRYIERLRAQRSDEERAQ